MQAKTDIKAVLNDYYCVRLTDEQLRDFYSFIIEENPELLEEIEDYSAFDTETRSSIIEVFCAYVMPDPSEAERTIIQSSRWKWPTYGASKEHNELFFGKFSAACKERNIDCSEE